LATVSEQLRLNYRLKVDIIARLGGEEFAILVINSTSEEVNRLAEDIRQSIENYEFISIKKPIKLTASLGCVYYEKAIAPSLESLYREADKALYQAKGNGRNQVQYIEKIEEVS
jgi:diguanylate cyclase (GGDEF)-like protein